MRFGIGLLIIMAGIATAQWLEVWLKRRQLERQPWRARVWQRRGKWSLYVRGPGLNVTGQGYDSRYTAECLVGEILEKFSAPALDIDTSDVRTLWTDRGPS